MNQENYNCQSHLSDETLAQMQRDFEYANSLLVEDHLVHPTTPEVFDYMTRQHHELNPHECHWINTALGKAWVGRQ